MRSAGRRSTPAPRPPRTEDAAIGAARARPARRRGARPAGRPAGRRHQRRRPRPAEHAGRPRPQLAEAAGHPNADRGRPGRSGRPAPPAPCSSARPTGWASSSRRWPAGCPPIRTGETVEAIEPCGPRPRLADRHVSTDAEVEATPDRGRRRGAHRPAVPAAGLLRPIAPAAAGLLAGIEYASVVLVTRGLRVRRRRPPARRVRLPRAPMSQPGCSRPARSPRRSGRTSRRRRRRPGHPAAFGRAGRRRAGRSTWTTPSSSPQLLAELDRYIGVRGDPVEVRVTRWPRSFPQYAVGHLDRVAEIESSARPDGARPDRGRRRLPRARRSRLHRAGPRRPPGRRSPSLAAART